MAYRFRDVLLLGLVVGSVFAVPADLNGLAAAPHNQPETQKTALSSPFRKLQNILIESVWGKPPKETLKSSHHSSNHHGPIAPSNFLSQYGGDVVLRFSIDTEQEANALAKAADILYLDIWESSSDWVDIRMAKDMVPSLLGLLPESLQHSHTPLMHDLAQTVYESYPSYALEQSAFSLQPRSTLQNSYERDEGRELFFRNYQPLSVIYPWMRLLKSLFPTHVNVFSIGKSYEGRDILALQLGVKPDKMSDEEPRHTIVFSGGSHAREWISVTTANYVAYSLITRYGKFPGVTKLLETYNFVFIPILNPDGYVHTWESDRLWRKNRQQTSLPFCRGVDLDRAFGFAWDGATTSDNPCSENYAGSTAFAGVEAKALADWAQNAMTKNNVSFIGFLDLHSYSQQILYPYSYSCKTTPPSLETLEELAYDIAKGFRLTNDYHYSVSSACEGSIQMSEIIAHKQPKITMGGGSALDWFYHEMKVKYAYQIKLRDTGSYGFLLPKWHIIPTGQEAFNALMSLGKYLFGEDGFENGIEWDAEFIMNVKSAVSQTEPEDVELVLEEEEEYIGIEDDEIDRNLDLRRRRRK